MLRAMWTHFFHVEHEVRNSLRGHALRPAVSTPSSKPPPKGMAGVGMARTRLASMLVGGDLPLRGHCPALDAQAPAKSAASAEWFAEDANESAPNDTNAFSRGLRGLDVQV